MQLTESVIANYWSKVDKSAGATGCWLWKSSTDKDGYGQFYILRVNVKAAHVALALAGKVRPSSKHGACHTCDTPACQQPLHLFWGTQLDNMRDAANKGRTQSGERHSNAKLTTEKVSQIKLLIELGVSQTDIAILFHVSKPTITKIKKGLAWTTGNTPSP